MYNKMMSKVIQNTPNLATVKVFDFLLNEPKFDGGVFTTKRFVAGRLNITMPTIIHSFQWLIDNHFITESSRNGIPKFIINENFDSYEQNNPKPKDVKSENPQPKPTVVRKGGKTVTRMEIPDF